jgi:hypothetical protein
MASWFVEMLRRKHPVTLKSQFFPQSTEKVEQGRFLIIWIGPG